MDYKFSILSLLISCLVIGQAASSQLLQMQSMESLIEAESAAKNILHNTTITTKQITKDIDSIQKKMHQILRKLKKEGHLEVAKEIAAMRAYIHKIESIESLKLSSEVDEAAAEIKKEILGEEKEIDVSILAESRKIKSPTKLADAAVKVVDKDEKILINETEMTMSHLGKEIRRTVDRAQQKLLSFANKTRHMIYNVVHNQAEKVSAEADVAIANNEVHAISEVKNESNSIKSDIHKSIHSIKGPVLDELKNMTPRMIEYVTELKEAIAQARVIAKEAKEGAKTITSLANGLNRTTEAIQRIQHKMIYQAHRLVRFAKNAEEAADRAEINVETITKAIKAIKSKEKSSKKHALSKS